MKHKDELLTLQLRQRLSDAEKTLSQFERKYKGDSRYYADQIQYVTVLRERLNSLG